MQVKKHQFKKKKEEEEEEATVRTGHGTTDEFKIGKGVCQGCILSLCLFIFFEECACSDASVLSDSLQPYGL